jgi:hypothetical protein
MIILHIVQYGSEIWSLTLREEHRFRVSENRQLIRIFGPERKAKNNRITSSFILVFFSKHY